MRLDIIAESTRKKKSIQAFSGEHLRRKSTWKTLHRWKRKHNKVNVKAIEQESVNWIDLAHDRTSSGLL